MHKKIQMLGRGALVIVMAATLFGCGETTEPQSDAPELPPLQSMQMDLGFFGDPGVAAAAAAEATGLKLNFLNAAVRAAFVNVAVVTILAPPSLAFAAAIHTHPSRVDDSYVWIYTWIHNGQDHQIRLHGTPNGDHVDWELYVVLPGAEAELWFTGRNYIDRDEGYWVFSDFNAPGDPRVLRIDWDMNSETDATLNFLNIHEGHEDEGDQLRYRGEGSLNSIEFTDASTGTNWDILWDESDGTGSLRVPDYNNGERACWDSDQEDVVCDAAAGGFLAGSLR